MARIATAPAPYNVFLSAVSRLRSEMVHQAQSDEIAEVFDEVASQAAFNVVVSALSRFGYETVPEGQGDVARRLEEVMAQIWEHWDRPRELRQFEGIDDNFTYEPVGLNAPTSTVRVRYKLIGKMQPMPYPIDE